MSESFDRDGWEQRWQQVLREKPELVASRPPNGLLLAEAGSLEPGLALDAGCGHGAEALWLATSGWRVTAVDFSVAALEHASARARSLGPDIADRVDWVEGDLGTWAPEPGHFDLVSCLYVHVAGSPAEMVTRLGSGVAPGGTLLLVGTPAPGQRQVSLEDAHAALDPADWDVQVAEERPGRGATVDVVVRAVRRAP